MAEMTTAEWRALLTDPPARTGKLATTRADGRPHVAPIWFVLDGDEVVFTTSEDSVKGRAVRRDGRVCLCVDDERPPYAFVLLEGRVRIDPDPDVKLHWCTVIAGRYLGAELAERYGRRNAVPSELIVRFRPDRVVAQRNIAD